MGSVFEKTATVLLVAAALVVAAGVAFQSFSGARVPGERGLLRVDDWERVREIGRIVRSPPGAAVTITTLADFECPACAGFHRNILKPMEEDGDYRFEVVLVHHPLTYHRQALPAARAAECVTDRGAFAAWVDLMYEVQDSLGIKSWAEYAARAGVADTARIASCAESSETPSRVEAGLDFGDEIDLQGTPTVMINGWRFGGVPSRAELEAAMEAVLDGRRPPGAARGGPVPALRR